MNLLAEFKRVDVGERDDFLRRKSEWSSFKRELLERGWEIRESDLSFRITPPNDNTVGQLSERVEGTQIDWEGLLGST